MPTRLVLTLVITTLAAVNVGCWGPTRTSDEDVLILNLEQFDALVDQKNIRVVLLDVRPTKDYEQSHIPGALNIPLPDLIANDPRLAEATQIVTYDGNWSGNLSIPAAKRLIFHKYKNVSTLRGGMEAWKADNRPVAGADADADE